VFNEEWKAKNESFTLSMPVVGFGDFLVREQNIGKREVAEQVIKWFDDLFEDVDNEIKSRQK